MSEYEAAREHARRYGAWNELDMYAKKLISRVVPKAENPVSKFEEYALDVKETNDKNN